MCNWNHDLAKARLNSTRFLPPPSNRLQTPSEIATSTRSESGKGMGLFGMPCCSDNRAVIENAVAYSDTDNYLYCT